MDVLTAKKLVIEAGERLVETGLIARPWGNVSCRVDDKTFVITPSGKPYIGLEPDDIVEVAINTLEWGGNVKPSSEKGIHASCYELRPETNFVIHTHQKNASVVSTLGLDINNIAGEDAEILGTDVPCASYGLPGQPKLREGVIGALERSESKAVIMKHHGAVCLGTDYDDAFKVANEVEKVCADFVAKKYNSITNKVAEGFGDVYNYFVEHPDKQERIAFLKKEYGIGGSYDGKRNKDHDGKGIRFSRGQLGNPVAEVHIKWNEAEKRIDKLIKQGRYLTERDIINIHLR